MTRGGAAGFTLLEVLVAFIIAALALGVFYQGAIAGLRNARVAGAYEQALSLARSHMAEISQRQLIQPVAAEGSDGPRFHYKVQVSPIASTPLQRSLLEQANNRPTRQATLYALSVTESWSEDGHTRQVSLLSEGMAAAVAK